MKCPESHGDKDCQHDTPDGTHDGLKHLHEYDSPPGGHVIIEWGPGESNYPEV